MKDNEIVANEAERAFTRRKFHKALQLANMVLAEQHEHRRKLLPHQNYSENYDDSDDTIIDMCTPLDFLGWEADVEEDDDEEDEESCSKQDGRDNPKNTISTYNGKTIITTTSRPRRRRLQHQQQRRRFRVRITNRVTPVDRAAAIVLQCLYELSTGIGADVKVKVLVDNGTNQSKTVPTRNVHDDCMTARVTTKRGPHAQQEQHRQKMRKDLEHFFLAYGIQEQYTKLDNNKAKDCSSQPLSHSIPMPLDLVIMWSEFCYSVEGYSGCTAACIAAEILHFLLVFHSQKSHQEKMEWYRDQCERLLHLLMVEILPHISTADIVEEILDAIISDVPKIDGSNFTSSSSSWWWCWWYKHIHPLCLSNHANINAITVIIEKLELVSSSSRVHPSVGGCIEQCLNDLRSLMLTTLADVDRNVKLHPSNAADTDNATMSSVVQSISNRTRASSSSRIGNSTDDDNNNHNEKKKNDEKDEESHPPSSIFNIHSIQNQIWNPLWNDEDRWVNRGKVLAIGFVTYATWTKRKRIKDASRSMACALIVAPIRELVEALTDKE